MGDEELMGIVNISFEQSDGKKDGNEEKGDNKKDEDKIIHEEKATNFNSKDEKEI